MIPIVCGGSDSATLRMAVGTETFFAGNDSDGNMQLYRVKGGAAERIKAGPVDWNNQPDHLFTTSAGRQFFTANFSGSSGYRGLFMHSPAN